METGPPDQPKLAHSGSYAFRGSRWTPTPHLARLLDPGQSIWLSTLAYSRAFGLGAPARPGRPAPPPEPQLLRPRPTSLRSQDVSHLLAGVFRGLYSAEALGAELGACLLRARGSHDARQERFVDELRKVRELYKQRLDEVEMLERHIIQAYARSLAEKERAMNQVQALESFIKMPPVRTIFRWCVDNSLLQKHHLISPDDYYSDPVPFCSAPKRIFSPGYLKPTFSFGKRSVPQKVNAPLRKALTKCSGSPDHLESRLTQDSSKSRVRTKERVKEAGLPKNKRWMKHLPVPQREQERRLLARMEYRNHFLKNPRFYAPNTPQGGKSLLFAPKKAAQNLDVDPSCAETPVFLANPSIGFFTDYEIGPVYEMVISLQNTTATSRHLRVLPPSTPYFSLGLGMFPGRGGMVAPGLTCQYTVQFFPDCLGDFDDFLLVETQSAHTLLVPLQARRPPPVLTLSPVLDCGYCLVGGMKMTRFLCRNVGFSVGKFCIMPQKSWPPPSFRSVATPGFVELPPFGIRPSVFKLAPGQAILVEVVFLPTDVGKAQQTFVVVCDNCQVKELVTEGVGQLVALDLIYISGDKSEPEPGELTDLTAQHFIRFEPENLRSTAKKQLVIRNATHVELGFRWQIMKPNLQPLLPGETFSLDSISFHPDWESAFSIVPQRGFLSPHRDHEFILNFSPHEPRDFHSVLQMVLEDVPEPVSSESEDLRDLSYFVDDVIVLEVEVKGSVEPFQVLLEPYALFIPGENYIGITMKKDFKMWNNSKSAIAYRWRKISDCHIVEVEPCLGAIEPNEVEYFELNFTGGAPGPTSQDLLCDIKNSPSPVVLHIETAFKGPALVIDVSALQFGLIRLGQKATSSIQIRNISQLPATWYMKESQACLQERGQQVSPFDIEPSSGHVPPLGECRVSITFDALSCQRLQTVLELEVVNGAWSYLPVYAEVQQPHVFLLNSHVEVSNLYLGVATKAIVTLVNGTLLPTQFCWGKLLGPQASFCTIKVSPRQGLLGPSEERLLHLEFMTDTPEELTDLALPCNITGMEKPLVLGISGKPQGLTVAIEVSKEDSKSRPPPDDLRLDFGSTVPLRTCVIRRVILTNFSPIQTSFSLKLEHFGSPDDSQSRKPSPPDIPTSLLKTSRIQRLLAKREKQYFMDNMLSHGKGAAFFPHVAQGLLGAHQQLRIDITGCADMWGEYWDKLICTVGDQPPTVIPVYLAAVGCPISCLRPSYYTADQVHVEPIIRFGTHVSGGNSITRTLRLNNSSPCDIRLDWETYSPDSSDDRLVDLLVYYGPLFPLRDRFGNELVLPETPGSRVSRSPSASSGSEGRSSSQPTTQDSAGAASAASPSTEAPQKLISVILREHEGVPTSQYQISPKQVVVPARGSCTISITFTPGVLCPEILHKVECLGYALGFMSLDSEVERELPGLRRRKQDFEVGPLRLDLHSYMRPAQLSMELDYGRGVIFRHQASDLIPERPCSGVLAELVTTQHLKLTNTTEIPYYFRLLVSKPFSVSQEGAKTCRRKAPGPKAPGPKAVARAQEDKQLVLHPQENMLVNVSFTLSLELLSYQKLPADQMLPGVEIQQNDNGEKEMVFTQDLVLKYSNQTTQVVPLKAIVAVPELQLSTSWVDFGTCFVNQGRVREVQLMNLSGCTSYWTVLMGQQKPDKDPVAFSVSPSSGLLQARPVNAPPTSIPLQILFKARKHQLYESTLVVEGVLGEKVCKLRLRGKGSNDERYMAHH